MILARHAENVAADKNHDPKAECEGVLTIISSLKFVKMLMFLLDLHEVTKCLSLAFQREEFLLIEVKPLLKQTILNLQNLQEGKGLKMLEFSDCFEETGQYKGVELNRARYATRSKTQARLEQFSLNKQENEEMYQALFSSYDF